MRSDWQSVAAARNVRNACEKPRDFQWIPPERGHTVDPTRRMATVARRLQQHFKIAYRALTALIFHKWQSLAPSLSTPRNILENND
jgi:hypothetical protein